MFFDQFTPEQMQAQYVKNAAGLRSMLEKAKQVAPKKVNGYTVAQLAKMAALYDLLATRPHTEWPAIRAEFGCIPLPR